MVDVTRQEANRGCVGAGDGYRCSCRKCADAAGSVSEVMGISAMGADVVGVNFGVMFLTLSEVVSGVR